jgi:hypothetical protein
MVGTVFPKRIPARTNRGERPDKMRHPQRCNSTDVSGTFINTHPNNTISLEICNPYRHEKIYKNTPKVRWWLKDLRLFSLVGFPLVLTRKIPLGPLGCVIMGAPCHYLIDREERSKTHERKSASNHVGAVRPCGKSAGPDPAQNVRGRIDADEMPVRITE